MKLILLLLLICSTAALASAETRCDTAECLQYGLSPEVIMSYPEPNITALEANQRLMHDRWYVYANDTFLEIYDAPHGNLVRTIEAGFNFFTALSEEGGWIQINTGEWVQAEKVVNRTHAVSSFTGVFLPEEPLPYTMAWVLVNLRPSFIPGGPPTEQHDMLWRYTRVSIYDTVDVDGFRWYQIGINKWVHQFNVAKLMPIERPESVDTDYWISIDLYEQVMVAYENDRPVFGTLIASGLDRWPTLEGTFNIYFRSPRRLMRGGVPGDDFYYLEEVPWTMFFDEGRALHGAYWHDGFGYRRSHGCVNLSITDAHWLYHWVADHMGTTISADVEVGPAVYVYTSDEYR